MFFPSSLHCNKAIHHILTQVQRGSITFEKGYWKSGPSCLFTLNAYCPRFCSQNDHALYIFVLSLQTLGFFCKGHVVELGNYLIKAISWEITVRLLVEMFKSRVCQVKMLSSHIRKRRQLYESSLHMI